MLGATRPGLDLLVPSEISPGPRPAFGRGIRRAVVVDTSGDGGSPAMAFARRLSARAASVELLDGPGLPVHPEDLDLVVGVTGPDADARIAARIARHADSRFVVVLRDHPTGPVDDAAAALRTADRVTVPSEVFRHALTTRGVDGHRIAFLPRWAGCAPPFLDRSDARRRLRWPERGFIAVHPGPLDAAHDPADVLDAARLLGPGRLVVITGDGPLRPKIEARAAGDATVLISGPLPADLAPLALVAADALLVTQDADSGLLLPPGEVADYLTAGRPVVAAVPVAGTAAAELSRAAGAGLVVPPGEPGRLAGALLALHADPGRRVSMGLAGLAYAEDQLSRSAVLARFDRIVDAALAGRPG